jgi:hypothetical protein
LQRQRLLEVHGLWSNDTYGFHLEPKIKKPESIWLVGLDSESRFELALAVFIRESPLRPQAKVKSAHVRKDSEVGAQRQTRVWATLARCFTRPANAPLPLQSRPPRNCA